MNAFGSWKSDKPLIDVRLLRDQYRLDHILTDTKRQNESK